MMKRIGIIGLGVAATGLVDLLVVFAPIPAIGGALSPYVVIRGLIAAVVGALLARRGSLPRALLGAGGVSVIPTVLAFAVLVLTGHALELGPAAMWAFLVAALLAGVAGGVFGVATDRARRLGRPSV